jgi:hypothetical protein
LRGDRELRNKYIEIREEKPDRLSLFSRFGDGGEFSSAGFNI